MKKYAEHETKKDAIVAKDDSDDTKNDNDTTKETNDIETSSSSSSSTNNESDAYVCSELVHLTRSETALPEQREQDGKLDDKQIRSKKGSQLVTNSSTEYSDDDISITNEKVTFKTIMLNTLAPTITTETPDIGIVSCNEPASETVQHSRKRLTKSKRSFSSQSVKRSNSENFTDDKEFLRGFIRMQKASPNSSFRVNLLFLFFKKRDNRVVTLANPSKLIGHWAQLMQ